MHTIDIDKGICYWHVEGTHNWLATEFLLNRKTDETNQTLALGYVCQVAFLSNKSLNQHVLNIWQDVAEPCQFLVYPLPT